MEKLEFHTTGIDLSWRSRVMGDATTQALVQKVTVFKQSCSGGKVWGGCTHVRAITNAVCYAKPDHIGNSLALVRKDQGVQRPCLLLPELDDMLRQGCCQWYG